MNKTALVMALKQFHGTLCHATDEQKAQACRMLHANGEEFLKKVPDRCFLQIVQGWEEAIGEAVERLTREEREREHEALKSTGRTAAIGIRAAGSGMEHSEYHKTTQEGIRDMGKGKKHRETIPALTERSKVVIEGRNALKYESGGAYLQGTRLLTVDPEDPELEIFADVLLGRDRIEQLYVVLRKGEAAREIRLI